MTENYEDFVSTVSHELRTPLTSIRGFAQTMLTSWDKLEEDDKKKFLKIIEEQSNRLITMVENILSVTKLQSTNDKLIYREVKIKPIIETVLQLIKAQYSDKNYIVQISENLPAIYADKDKFQQVMMNLIENASKYSLENKNITIQAGFCQNNCEMISIKVMNYGIEINPQDYDKIFTKFSRIDNPLTRKTQGSGLGLYITKNIVEKMGGKISVNSKKINDNIAEITFEIQLPTGDIEKQARLKCVR